MERDEAAKQRNISGDFILFVYYYLYLLPISQFNTEDTAPEGQERLSDDHCHLTSPALGSRLVANLVEPRGYTHTRVCVCMCVHRMHTHDVGQVSIMHATLESCLSPSL